MAVMIVAHPIPGFSGRVAVEEVGLNFIGGFAGPVNVPADVQAQLVGEGFTLNASPSVGYPLAYVTHQELADPESEPSVALRAAFDAWGEDLGSGFDVTGKTAAQINTYLAAGGYRQLVGAVSIAAPLVVVSDTFLDVRGARITLTEGSNCNMLRNQHYNGVGGRDKNITIIGGFWDRQSNQSGPDDQRRHSLFLHFVDGLWINGLEYASTGGKYGISLADVTDYTVRDIYGDDVHSDTVHITGPARRGLVENVHIGVGGDDVVGITTSEYPQYADTSGPIEGLIIRNISGSTTTRIVLVAGTASGVADDHDLTGIVIEDVTQLGAGDAVQTGASVADDGVLNDLTLSRINGGKILLRHHHHGIVTIDGGVVPAGFGDDYLAISAETATARIDKVIIRNVEHHSENGLAYLGNAGVTIGSLVLEAVYSDATAALGAITAAAKVGSLLFRDVTYEGTSDVIFIGGTAPVDQVVYDGCNFDLDAGLHVTRAADSCVIGQVVMTRSTVKAANTNSGDVVNRSGSAAVGRVSVNGTKLIGQRCVFYTEGGAGTVAISLVDVEAVGCNRLAASNGPSLDISYTNVRFASGLNAPFLVYGATAAMTVRGQGWSGGWAASAMGRETVNVLHAVAPDLPVDVSILAKTLGDTCHNTNAGLSCGAGPVISNGTNWKNTYSGATY